MTVLDFQITGCFNHQADLLLIEHFQIQLQLILIQMNAAAGNGQRVGRQLFIDAIQKVIPGMFQDKAPNIPFIQLYLGSCVSRGKAEPFSHRHGRRSSHGLRVIQLQRCQHNGVSQKSHRANDQQHKHQQYNQAGTASRLLFLCFTVFHKNSSFIIFSIE